MQKFIDLEKELLIDEIRMSREKLNELLHDDFMEITQSGTIYKKLDALKGLSTSKTVDIEAFNFSVKVLTEGLVRVLFETKATDIKKNIVKEALRSSLWKFEGGKWQIIFHQGTPKGK